MVIPVSIEAQFRRLNKNLKELKQLGKSSNSEDESIIVADICNSCVLALDKTMNEIWRLRSTKKKGKQKPKIYFPSNTTDKDKLTEKLKQYQMPNLELEDPDIFALLESVQPYRNVEWLTALHQIASIRHEEYPKVEKLFSQGLGFGRGQNLYIERLTIDGDGSVDFRGHGINQASGKIEPARIELTREVRSVLGGMDKSPYDFCASSVLKVKEFVSQAYMILSRK